MSDAVRGTNKVFLCYNRDKSKKEEPIMEGTLFIDPQAAVPACFCPRCGGECYAPTFTCIRCERRDAV